MYVDLSLEDQSIILNSMAERIFKFRKSIYGDGYEIDFQNVMLEMLQLTSEGINILHKLLMDFDAEKFPPKSQKMYELQNGMDTKNDAVIQNLKKFYKKIGKDFERNILNYTSDDDENNPEQHRKFFYFKSFMGQGKEIPVFLETIVAVLELLFSDHIIEEFSLIYSQPGLKDQQVHYDYFEKGTQMLSREDVLPFFCFVCLDCDTPIWIQSKQCSEKLELFIMKKYSLYICAGNQWHAGAGYNEKYGECNRIHFSLSTKKFRLNENSQTFLSDIINKQINYYLSDHNVVEYDDSESQNEDDIHIGETGEKL